MPELVTIPAVPIIRVGSYELGSGPATFTEEDIAAAVAAWSTDAGVKNPRIKIDSLEKAMNLDPAAHGGEPAFGWVENLQVSEDGQELLGDFVVPDFIEAGMKWAYPSLSIEGAYGFESATGRKHEMVVTAVALLGVHWPGVTTLEDFTAFLVSGPAEGELQEIKAGRGTVLAQMPVTRRPDVRASLDSDLVIRRFYDAIDSEDSGIEMPEGVSGWNLWIRSMRFGDDGAPYLKVTDEDGGTLYRVDFTVSGSDVNFGDFTEVVEQDVPVAAGARPAGPLATFATRAESRAVTASGNQHEEDASMTDEQRRATATAFGLDPETATVAEVQEAVAAAAAAPEATPEGEVPAPVETPQAEVPQEQPVAATASLPDGVVAISAEELAALRAGTATANALQAQAAQADRDQVITAAIAEGRIPPARRGQWESLWASDAAGTRLMLTAAEADGGLAVNTVPVQARGAEPTDETQITASDQAAHEAYMRRMNPKAFRKPAEIVVGG